MGLSASRILLAMNEGTPVTLSERRNPNSHRAVVMAHVRKGHLVAAPEWWRRLRPRNKRVFWKRHRRAERKEAIDQNLVLSGA